MGKRGPKSRRPDGLYITRKGYLRGFIDGRLQLAHVAAWERRFGPVPAGFQIHHIDGNKQNNSLDNLRVVSPTEHKRIHSGCEWWDNAWWKPCRRCGVFKRIDLAGWYLSREGWPLYGRCRACHIAAVVKSKKLRRLR